MWTLAGKLNGSAKGECTSGWRQHSKPSIQTRTNHFVILWKVECEWGYVPYFQLYEKHEC